jgi:YVTN family beta-propeller protein
MSMLRPCLLVLMALGLLCAAACKGSAADPNTLVVLAHAPSGEVRFLQIGSGKVTGRVQVGGEPYRLVRDAARGRVYVTDRAGDSVAVVDVVNQQLVKQVRVGREPRFAALSPDGARLYVALAGEAALAVVDAERLEVSGRVPVGGRPAGVAVSQDGSRVFVANDAEEAIAVVDTALARRMRQSMVVPGGVRGGLALSSDGTTLLAGARGKPALTTVVVATRSPRELPLGETGAPDTVLATPDGRFWVATLDGTETVVALPAGGGPPVPVGVGPQPSGLAVAPGGRLLVAAQEGENLSEVDLEKGKVTRRMRVGPGHTDVAVFSKSALDSLRAKAGG